MAAYKKKASKLKAFLVFVDESGMMMAPLVRRSRAPLGLTPILFQRTCSHKKVSAIAALCVSPKRDRVYLYSRLHPDANINTSLVCDFLKNLSRQIPGPKVLIWDRFTAHRAIKVKAFMQKSDIHSFHFPPYAPELNPVENVWGYLKTNPMANLAMADLNSLAKATHGHGRSLQRKEQLLHSFVKHTPLFLRLK
ncbi:MAG: transposase [Elusimicrobiota bacterium]